MRTIGRIVAFIAPLIAQLCHAIPLDTSSSESICQATSLIQKNIMEYYWGSESGGTVGMFKPPYYWWVAGEVFGGMLENWYLCGDKTYEDLMLEGMLAQTGTNYDYMPSNQTWVEGNDDQGIWGLLIMDAAERNFTEPTGSKPSWFAMAQAVFNTMNSRWDDASCGGGLRWQIFTWNNGYSYKNTIANACLFQMAARLGRYTGNSTYLDVASKVFDWLVDVKYIVLSDAANVYDGAHVETRCTNIVNQEWSYNHGVVLGACAYMYNATNGDPVWEDRVNKILQGALVTFFNNNIMYEASCQDAIKECNDDQRTFKSILSRMLSLTAVLVPSTRDRIYTFLEASARAAAQSCVGGSKQRSCGLNWAVQGHDGKYGLGEEISSLEVIQSLLYFSKPPPLTTTTGGSDKGDPNAGLDQSGNTDVFHSPLVIHRKDRVGATILTAAGLGVFVGGALWMVF